METPLVPMICRMETPLVPMICRMETPLVPTKTSVPALPSFYSGYSWVSKKHAIEVSSKRTRVWIQYEITKRRASSLLLVVTWFLRCVTFLIVVLSCKLVICTIVNFCSLRVSLNVQEPSIQRALLMKQELRKQYIVRFC